MSSKPDSSASGSHPDSKPTLEKAGLQDERLQSIHDQIRREKGEPSENFAPVPLYLVALCCVLTFWGGVYIAKYSGLRFDPFVYDERVTEAPSAPPAPVDPLVLGKRLYTQQCQACHQVDGKGQVGAFPPLAGSEWVFKGDGASRTAAILLHGLSGPITVNGNPYNGNMPAFPQWKDEQVAAVLTYIKRNPDWGQPGDPITPEQVAAVRAATAGRSAPWSERELLAQFPLE